MEFNKYKEYGAYHWKEYKQKTAYGKHVDFLLTWIGSGKTLDIGAGDGLITHLINGEGIDDNKIAIGLANEKGANVKLGDAYNLVGFDDNSFDNVLMADVIEHLEFPDIAINEVKRVLKPSGNFYVITPPAKNGGLWDKYHYREYTPTNLVDYMNKHQFELINDIIIRNEFVRMYGIFKNLK